VNTADPPLGRTRPIAFPLAVACVLIVYAFAASRQIALPGVYMDAVNPDYLVAKVLNRSHAEPLIAWVLPGNYLANRFPILVSLYHGLQQFWIGLPLYALFGMSVVGIRLTHMAFAIGVLVGVLLLLWRAHAPIWVVAICGIALAVDPAFIFAFRTQSYITMSPVAWLLLSIAMLAGDPRTETPLRHFVASGVSFGFAVLGYFVYAFYLPAMLPWIVSLQQPRDAPHAARRRRATLAWLLGVGFGCAYYVLGYALAARKVGGGWPGFVAYIGDSTTRLNAFSTQLPLVDRIGAAASFVEAVFTNGWHHQLMFGVPPPPSSDALKMTLLVALPVLLLAFAEARRRSTGLLRLAVGLPACFFAVSLAFGERLGGHHYMSFLPLAYVALALGLVALRGDMKFPSGIVDGASVACFAALAAINVAATHRELATLDRTGGVGLYSDAIDHLAVELAALSPKPLVYFPDWGLSMPVILITGGTVPASAILDPVDARRRLCHGQDVAIAIVGGDGSRFASWTREFQWTPPRVIPYAQRDGAVVAQLGVYAAAANPGNACR
jgi:hypothetical protein